MATSWFRYFFRLMLGVRKHLTSYEDRRGELSRYVITHKITLLAVVAALMFVMLDVFIERLMNIVVDVTAVFLFTSAIFLMRQGYFTAGKNIVITGTATLLTINSSYEGREAGNQYLWFPIVCSLFIMFSEHDNRSFWFSMVYSLICIAFLEYTDYNFFGTPPFSGKEAYFNRLICFGVSVSLLGFYVYVLVRSNTEAQKRQRRLIFTLKERNQQLKHTNQELDSFVYKASHDLRAPLTSILGLIQLLKGDDGSNFKQYIQLQEKSVKKLDSYIIDILNLSRNSRLGLEIKEINLMSMIDDAFNQLNYMERSKNIKKDIKITQSHKLYSDPRRLNVIVNNLLSNSIKYCDVSKREPLVSIEVVVNENEAEFSVFDNGLGINNEHMDHVFNMFYRANELSTGSGLGLYIVKETLMKMKGTVYLTSQAGEWTLIKVRIPNEMPLQQP